MSPPSPGSAPHPTPRRRGSALAHLRACRAWARPDAPASSIVADVRCAHHPSLDADVQPEPSYLRTRPDPQLQIVEAMVTELGTGEAGALCRNFEQESGMQLRITRQLGFESRGSARSTRASFQVEERLGADHRDEARDELRQRAVGQRPGPSPVATVRHAARDPV